MSSQCKDFVGEKFHSEGACCQSHTAGKNKKVKARLDKQLEHRHAHTGKSGQIAVNNVS